MSQPEQRLFKRIPFKQEAVFFDGAEQIEVSLLDLSLKGALIELHRPVSLSVGQNAELSFDLGEVAKPIAMEVSVCHYHDQEVGLRCERIDIDSISHLRRLVELNLGDSDLLERELSHLFNQD